MIAAFDIGTTAVKGVLLTEEGRAAASASRSIRTYFEDGHAEQEPEEWYRAFCEIAREFSDLICGDGTELRLIMSGQMQDVIPVGADGLAVGRAILYSDGRAREEAREIAEEVGDEYLAAVTGNHYDGSLSVPKMRWILKREPERFARTAAFLISSKDYIIRRLTGECAGDVTACSIAGGMDLGRLVWDERIMDAAGIPAEKLPRLLHAHDIAGYITGNAAADAGFPEGTPVYAGAGDAGATTLASGIAGPGEYNINLGTTGWVAAVSGGALAAKGGVVNLAAMPEKLCINVVPFLNAGNVHGLIERLFGQPEEAEDTSGYARLEELLERSVPGSHGVQFLPYLVGERFPVLDPQVRGSWIGVTPETRREDLVRAALEGVAYSIRQGLQSLGTAPRKISVIGGGARSAGWCKILASVLQEPLYVYADAEFLPAMALGAAVLYAEGRISSYAEFTEQLQGPEHCSCFEPDEAFAEVYCRGFERYRRLYPALKGYYEEGEAR